MQEKKAKERKCRYADLRRCWEMCVRRVDGEVVYVTL